MNIPIEPLLTVDQISVTFKDGREDLEALEEVSFSLSDKE
jgi:ABC-type microcin C transport system duplicated ATPase subunit YejF